MTHKVSMIHPPAVKFPPLILLGAGSSASDQLVQKIAKLTNGEVLDTSLDKSKGKGGASNRTAIARAMRAGFINQRALVCVMAAAIPIRILAGLLTDKRREPPVVVVAPHMAQAGASVTLLLGGDRGGFTLGARIAQELGVTLAGCGAGRSRWQDSPDELPAGWSWENPNDAKTVSLWRLNKEKISLIGDMEPPFSIEQSKPLKQSKPQIYVGERVVEIASRLAILRPPVLTLGVGTRRGVDGETLIKFVLKTLAAHKLSPKAVAGVATATLKADEKAIAQLCDALGKDSFFFDSETLAQQEHRIANPSKRVVDKVGTASVSEAAALLLGGDDSQLIVEKTKSKDMTLAVAIAPLALEVDNLPGIKRGKLSVVGIGPGDLSLLTIAALDAIEEADEIVGFDEYIDRIQSLLGSKRAHGYPIGDEAIRAAYALKLAAEGKRVALVCSGDPGVFALAGLVLETLEASADALVRGAEITVIPGVTAANAASAKVGAMLGHDHVSISLSDLLTPALVIENRLRAAANSDLVVALYNPQSQKRRKFLPLALEIFAKKRPEDTPVVFAHKVSRKEESIKTFRLGHIPASEIAKVDMNTIVLIGATNSKFMQNPMSEDWLYTPRGYKVES